MEGKWVGKEESKVCSDIQDDFKTERLTTPGHLMMTPGQDHLGM